MPRRPQALCDARKTCWASESDDNGDVRWLGYAPANDPVGRVAVRFLHSLHPVCLQKLASCSSRRRVITGIVHPGCGHPLCDAALDRYRYGFAPERDRGASAARDGPAVSLTAIAG